MRLAEKHPPRAFEPAPGIAISDCGDVELRPDEQVTLVTEAGKRMDVAAKDFGFYATPSVNGRLKGFQDSPGAQRARPGLRHGRRHRPHGGFRALLRGGTPERAGVAG